MRKGLTFNGVHSSTLNLAILSTKRPLLPENRDTYIDIPYRNGSFLIPDKSRKDVIVTVDFLLTTPRNSNLYAEARRVGKWLTTDDRAPLIFDDDPSYTYYGKVIGNIEIEKIIKYGKFSVQFRCLPEDDTNAG